MTPAEVTAAAQRLVRRTCAVQSVAETLTDAATLRALAAIVSRRDAGAPKDPGNGRSPVYGTTSATCGKSRYSDGTP